MKTWDHEAREWRGYFMTAWNIDGLWSWRTYDKALNQRASGYADNERAARQFAMRAAKQLFRQEG